MWGPRLRWNYPFMNISDREAKISILVVEDEPVIRMLVGRVLVSRDRHLVVTDCMQEALSQIHQKPFDLLLTDLRLPDGHGVEVMRQFRNKFPRAPMIVMTGSLTPEDHF